MLQRIYEFTPEEMKVVVAAKERWETILSTLARARGIYAGCQLMPDGSGFGVEFPADLTVKSPAEP